MGQLKNIQLGREESIEIIEELMLIINKLMEKSMPSSERLKKYKHFLSTVYIEYNDESRIYDSKLYSFVIEFLDPILLKARKYLENTDLNDQKTNIYKKYLTQIYFYFDRAISYYYENKNEPSQNNAINSENYYRNKINELQSREDELLKALKITKEKTEIELDLAKTEVEITKNKIKEYKNELELKKKEEDAKNNWEEKINSAFKELKSYLEPLRKEKERLETLYNIYRALSGILIFLVAIFECIIIYKVTANDGIPDIKQYITIYLPLPIVGALLWGFIFQMNRAQRQLVVLAKNNHNIEYIQGLLLTINKLTPSVEDGISRINHALDELIKKHLGVKEEDYESKIIKEESKDSLPVDSVIKILKELKGLKEES